LFNYTNLNRIYFNSSIKKTNINNFITTIFLLTFIRFGNALTATDKTTAFNEAIGRTVGWFSLLFNKPTVA